MDQQRKTLQELIVKIAPVQTTDKQHRNTKTRTVGFLDFQ